MNLNLTFLNPQYKILASLKFQMLWQTFSFQQEKEKLKHISYLCKEKKSSATEKTVYLAPLDVLGPTILVFVHYCNSFVVISKKMLALLF